VSLPIPPLARKLLRDLVRLRWQALAIAVLIAAGVAVTVMAYSTRASLAAARDRFYVETRFADVFAVADRAPLGLARQLEAIDGVVGIDLRIQRAGVMAVPGIERPAIARFISLPENEQQALNLTRLVLGRMPAPGRSDEALVLRSFFDATQARLGDRLSAVVGGRRLDVIIVGVVFAPEFVWVPGAATGMPDDAHQGVFWMRRAALERAADMDGAFNTAAVKLAPGAPPAAVRLAMDRILAPYGAAPAIERKDQASDRFIVAEFKELQISATVFPPIFLIVAAFLVHMLMSRHVEVEREQIGLLKAFGYRDWEAAWPYAALAMAITLLGCLLGALLGGAFASLLVDVYRAYMRFPDIAPRFHWGGFALASFTALAAGLVGAIASVRAATRLSPALAMRAPSPARYARGWLDRATQSFRLGEPSRIILRNLERRPGRAAMTVLGLAASIALLIGTQFLHDAMNLVFDHAFYRAQRWSHFIALAGPRELGARAMIEKLPGVLMAEPVRSVSATLSTPHHSERMAITGISMRATLIRPLDRAGRPIAVSGPGLTLSDALARKLQVQPGDPVLVTTHEGQRTQSALPVLGLARDYAGLSAYMDRRDLNRFLKEGDAMNAAALVLAPHEERRFYAAVSAMPLAASASSRDEAVASYRRIMSEAFSTSLLFYLGFAGAIAFGVAYNAARISLAERARDLATMRVLGFTRGETAYVQLGEFAILGLAAIPVGIFFGWLLAQGISSAYARDEMRLPLVMSRRAIGTCLAAYFTVMFITGALIAQRVGKLDLVAVLKARE